MLSLSKQGLVANVYLGRSRKRAFSAPVQLATHVSYPKQGHGQE
jgi:hypothetical protein